jgi:hypothetical protein
MAENEWRAVECPDYGQAFCDCNWVPTPPECPGYWDCVDIENLTVEVFNYYNNNGDLAINIEDDID